MKQLLPAILFTSMAATSASAFAHNECNIDLQGGLHIEQNTITFKKNDKALYSIVDDQTLMLNNQVIDLTSNQQSLVTEYSTSIRQTVPQVKEIAVGAIDVAVEGVNMAFDQLLGEGNNVSSDLTYELGRIRTEIDARFSSDKGFYIDENGIQGDDLLGEDFDNHIESVVEDAVQKSMGTVMIALGQELLFSGGNMESFETRMEDFGQQIELQMEERAMALEEKGDQLCRSIVAIDELEEQMKNEIPEIAHTDVLKVTSHNRT